MAPCAGDYTPALDSGLDKAIISINYWPTFPNDVVTPSYLLYIPIDEVTCGGGRKLRSKTSVKITGARSHNLQGDLLSTLVLLNNLRVLQVPTSLIQTHSYVFVRTSVLLRIPCACE